MLDLCLFSYSDTSYQISNFPVSLAEDHSESHNMNFLPTNNIHRSTEIDTFLSEFCQYAERWED